ncbi:MAG: class I SAM-dependent DNA methyltransferase [Acidobacteria bacterium]|nr:class I SAM-dependent DNA methyltransferase [Acidobacteriota bacterium]
MPQLTQAEIRNNAVSFVHEWKEATRERAEAQTFWNEFLEIFGVRRRRVAVFEKAVKKTGGRYGAIDLFWRGVLLVEHKSRGQNLDKATSQAFEYLENLPEIELPKCVIISDFGDFRLFDLETEEEHEFTLEELPDKIHLFGFISGYTKRTYKDQDPVNIAVAEKMGDLHDALLESGYKGHKLEIFLVRLVYCLFADDTGIFPKDHFRFFIEEKTDEGGANLGAMLSLLFQLLDTPTADRQRSLDEDLQQFPHVNGALFSERIDLPFFNRKMRNILLEACSFDWSKVSPAIFGSLFQSAMDAEKRRNLGAHYTSEQNILKVVRGLFLDDLYAEFESIKHNAARVRQFHEKLASLKFFDPACGSGNFLVITYREVRLLEIEILKQLRALTGRAQLELDVTKLSKIDVDSFYGIEYEEFAAQIAMVALWLTDHQANMRLSAEFGLSYARLPLRKTPNIRHANALRFDWSELVSTEGSETETNLYILGNPPFVGKEKRSNEQTADMDEACAGVTNYRTLDYVAAWYIRAAQFIQNTRIKAAFVSTNSITQGEQVGILWSYLFDKNIKIHFAHRTFKWNNEARGKAAVHCVIIGFGAFDVLPKYLFDYQTPVSEPHEIQAQNINPYLIDYSDLVISDRNAPICDVPAIVNGNKPTDGGYLLMTDQERSELLSREPDAEKFIKPFVSAHEFINGEIRWCLWLEAASMTEWRRLPEVMKRVQAVREFRLKSKKEATVRIAEVPYLFGQIRQPNSNYVLIPRHSSENRRYVPMAFFPKTYIVADSCASVPNATLYHFGVLTSQMHMAWMRQICGRLKSDYRYSNSLVYNNFPFPAEPSAKQRERVEQAAQAVLDARAGYPEATLADLYDPNTMPKDLLDAHRDVDTAVDACYGSRRFRTDLERLEFLFDLYRQYTDPLTQLAEKETRKAKRRRSKQ